MNIKLNLVRAFMLMVIASFASTTFAVTPVLVNSESTALMQSVEGVWEFGCDNEDPGIEPDENEFLIFRGDRVEGQTLKYTSSDGSCSGTAVAISEGYGSVVVVGDFPTFGWLGEEGPVPPPPRQDSSGPLNAMPTATLLEFVLPTGESETGLYYMDDTAEPWCLWRGAEDDGVRDAMSAEEPLCKVDIQLDPLPICDIQLNQASFVDGDTITAAVFRFANPSASPVAIEAKIWFAHPGSPTQSMFNQGADGNYVLPAGMDIDIGPLPIDSVTSAWPRGGYELGCRMFDPVIGEAIMEDRNFFEVQ